MSDFFNDIGDYFAQYGMRIALSACVIVAGILLSWLLGFLIKRILRSTKIDNAASSFIVAIVKVVIVVAVVLICASILDLSTSSLLVSLSTVALAVALALKDSLANLANGILIITNKPFKRGDYVSINGVEGKIQNIKLLTVELVAFNNTKIILPNSKVIGGDVLNYSAMPIRRVDMNYSVAYGSNMDRVEKILRKLADNDDRILKTVPPLIFMQTHDSSSIQYVFNVWVNTVDFFAVKNSMPRKVYDAFEKDNIRIPFNQLDVHMFKGAPEITEKHAASIKSAAVEKIDVTEKPIAREKTNEKIVSEKAVEKPVASEKVVGEKIAAKPIASEKIAAKPIASEKVAAKPIASEKVAAKPVASEKVAVKPIASEKVVSEKIAAKPVASEKVAAKPVASEKVVSEKVAAKPVASEKVAAEKPAAKKPSEKTVGAKK